MGAPETPQEQPSSADYDELHVADLDYAACVLEELADEVARSGAGRAKADQVAAAALAVRMAIEILNDLHASVLARGDSTDA